MQPGPGSLEQACVRRVADQDVAEVEVVGCARLRPADELLAAQRGERRLNVGLAIALLEQSRHRVAGELQPDHRGRLRDSTLGRLQAVEAGTKQGRDVSGDRNGLSAAGEHPAPGLLTQEPVIDQHGEHLLNEQGVAFREAEDAPLQPLGKARRTEQVPHHEAGLLPGQLLEFDLGRRPSSCGEA